MYPSQHAESNSVQVSSNWPEPTEKKILNWKKRGSLLFLSLLANIVLGVRQLPVSVYSCEEFLVSPLR